jgi:hypothetical protein
MMNDPNGDLIAVDPAQDAAAPQVRLDWPAMTIPELPLYNPRNAQEHAAQLSLSFGQKVGHAPGWVGRGNEEDVGRQ